MNKPNFLPCKATHYEHVATTGTIKSLEMAEKMANDGCPEEICAQVAAIGAAWKEVQRNLIAYRENAVDERKNESAARKKQRALDQAEKQAARAAKASGKPAQRAMLIPSRTAGQLLHEQDAPPPVEEPDNTLTLEAHGEEVPGSCDEGDDEPGFMVLEQLGDDEVQSQEAAQ